MSAESAYPAPSRETSADPSASPAGTDPEGLTDQEKIRLLPWSYAHNAFNSIFSVLTFFGPVFVLFLDALELPKTRIGFLLSLLPFCGLVAPFIAPRLARVGVKRVYITCWGLRKGVTALLLLTPWIAKGYGVDVAFWMVAGVVSLFAVLRAVGETAWYPWFQEVVPLFYRGRYNGINNFVAMLASCLTLGFSSYILGHVPGLHRFVLLIGTGVIAGVLCVVLALPIPGGGPGRQRESTSFRSTMRILQDRRFLLYLGYTGLTMVTMQSLLMAFVPLFMKEQVGLSEQQIILLQVGIYTTGLLSSYTWGWMADHRDSRMVLLVALSALILLPFGWISIPRFHPSSFYVALGIAGLAGSVNAGWWINDQRLLYVKIVPPEERTAYLAVYYAWIGLVGGTGPLGAGALLDATQGFHGRLGFLSLDPYTPLFLVGGLLLGIAVFLLTRLFRVDSGSRSCVCLSSQ